MRERVRRWLRPGWAWTVRYPRSIASGYSAAALFLGFGLSVIVPLATGGLHPDQVRRLTWIMILGFAMAAVLLAASETARQGRDRMLRRNGTAYIITERARDWDHDESAGFYSQVRQRFARVHAIPGPGQVDPAPAWDWPLDGDARHWDVKATELARSFRVLYLAAKADGASGTPDGIFVTAWWAVALAFGMRVTAADRSLDLHVWQRPSDGRAGKIQPGIWTQQPHRAGDPVAGTDLAPAEFTWDADLTVRRHGHGRAAVSATPVSVLLVRFGPQPWGPLPRAGAEKQDEKRWPLTLHDPAGVLPIRGTVAVHIHELRCTPAGDSQVFDWDQYPFLAASAVAWIQQMTAELAGHTLLLGVVMPNEIALEIGISAGRESCTVWPERLWPVIYRKPANTLIVPRLDLGTTALTE